MGQALLDGIEKVCREALSLRNDQYPEVGILDNFVADIIYRHGNRLSVVRWDIQKDTIVRGSPLKPH